MTRIIAVTNLKGGIGKTTTVVNVSAGFALKGARVLVVDVDAQGNLAMALGVRPRRTLYEVLVDGAKVADCITAARPNLDILPADESLLSAQPTIARRPDWPRVLEQALRPIRADYDFIFIDCGGSLTVLNLNALNAAGDVLVPTTVEPFSVKGLGMLVKQIDRVKGSRRALRAIVPTMFDPRLKQSQALLEELRATYGDLVQEPIRTNVRLSESSSAGRTIYEYDPRSRGAHDYARLVEGLSELFHFQPAPAVPAEPIARAATTPGPVVLGAGEMLSSACPQCGSTLHRVTVAGYRVAYCDKCRYRRQELAGGAAR
jgi:chromosome partitioning protein